MTTSAGLARVLGGVPTAASALVDLVLEGGCAGCSSPGGLLCPRCREALRGPARPAWPCPAPDALPQPWATAAYDGVVRRAVVAHKEHGRLALARPLGDALALAAHAALGAVAGPSAEVFLVPVPSRPSAVRARGHDPTLRLARRSAADLRRAGMRVRVLPALRLARVVADQAGLDAAGRAANLAGALQVPPGRAALVTGRLTLVVDDVITTGASLVEAARALRAVGAAVAGCAVVAATPRRTSVAPARGRPGLSL